MKKMISPGRRLSDGVPASCRRRGACCFQTEMADFDREHPGLYLCKLRNVELVFVGITGATSHRRLAAQRRRVEVPPRGRHDRRRACTRRT